MLPRPTHPASISRRRRRSPRCDGAPEWRRVDRGRRSSETRALHAHEQKQRADGDREPDEPEPGHARSGVLVRPERPTCRNRRCCHGCPRSLLPTNGDWQPGGLPWEIPGFAAPPRDGCALFAGPIRPAPCRCAGH
jgi:hypothetical protein